MHSKIENMIEQDVRLIPLYCTVHVHVMVKTNCYMCVYNACKAVTQLPSYTTQL